MPRKKNTGGTMVEDNVEAAKQFSDITKASAPAREDRDDSLPDERKLGAWLSNEKDPKNGKQKSSLDKVNEDLLADASGKTPASKMSNVQDVKDAPTRNRPKRDRDLANLVSSYEKNGAHNSLVMPGLDLVGAGVPGRKGNSPRGSGGRKAIRAGVATAPGTGRSAPTSRPKRNRGIRATRKR